MQPGDCLEQVGRSRVSGRHALVAGAALTIVLFCMFALVLTLSILRERDNARQVAQDRALAASQVVATNAVWIAELSRQALARIDESLGSDIAAGSMLRAQSLRDAVANLPGNVKSYVVAADGETLFSTDPDAKPIDIRDRPYFSELAAGKYWYVSPLMVSRLSGDQIFVFSKRLERDGRFAGVAVLSFDAVLLRGVWESLGFDGISTVSLVRNDGWLVAGYPFPKGPLDLSGYDLFTRHLPEADSGAYVSESPSDGLLRIVGYRRVPGTDFIALASISMESAYATYRRNTVYMLTFAVPTAIGLFAALGWIFWLLRKDQLRRTQLMETLELNRLLVRDTHHRVKNNLQAVMSIVRMHPLPAELKTDLQGRIAAMSAVHEHLYRLDQFAEVEASTLIPAIVDPLLRGFGRPVTVEYDLDAVILDRDHATPLALLASETVTNALKYAFPDNRPGTIRVAFKRGEGESFVLSVHDDGVGFDHEAATSGLGTRIIRAMVQQLAGDYAYSFDHGTLFEARLQMLPTHRPGADIAAPPSLKPA